ncbi:MULTISPECIES: transposase family protein [unclassified Streptomyces]|uniref:transposase family protein n=1 Tax=unclassified Streptomyces TaxID=2593676 RepID=UPI000A6CB780|nr:transposase family protein [Streptomyces sp. CB02058]
MPADASSLIPPALDQLREHPDVVSEEVPGLLERLAEVPDPRDPRGVRHRLAVVLALTACAVLAGATSLLAVSDGSPMPRRTFWNGSAPIPIRFCPGGSCPPRQRSVDCWPA